MDRKNSNGAVLIFATSTDGIPLVKDPSKPRPHLWKLPGGKVEIGETHAHAAKRELWEETGLTVPLEDLVMLDYFCKETHVLTVFGVEVSSLNELSKFGIEGEEVRIFNLGEINELKDLLPQHREVLGLLRVL